MNRFEEVSGKLKKMFKAKTETEKDEFVVGLKVWLKENADTKDLGKKYAIHDFLTNIGVN